MHKINRDTVSFGVLPCPDNPPTIASFSGAEAGIARDYRPRDPYRYEERRNAFINWGNTQTPESEAILKREEKLLDEHLQKRAYIMAAFFLIIDGIGIYYFWNHGLKPAPESLP